MPTPTRRQRRSGTSTSPQRTATPTASRPIPSRRFIERTAPEKVDYSQDYAFVRRDLNRIALWSLLLFAGMIAVYVVM